jgi:molybdate transport system regulatory protein
MPQPRSLIVKMRIRVYAGKRMLGPGKMELVAHIDATGSLAAAAKKMRMSYMRAWTLVQNLNSNPNRPVVEMSRGGVGGGTAKVTQFGKQVLAIYQTMDRESAKAASPYSRKLAKLLE